jgi:hypothetical protein
MSDQFLSELNLWCLSRQEAIAATGNANCPYFTLITSLQYRSTLLGGIIEIPKNFLTDLGSFRERSGGGSRQMIMTFPIRASSTITFTSKRAISARSSSHKNWWTAKQPIVSCVKQWQQSVHRTFRRGVVYNAVRNFGPRW